MDPRVWLTLAALCAFLTGVTAYLWLGQREERRRRAVHALAARIHRSGLWVGAWFVGIPSRRRVAVMDGVQAAAAGADGPTRIVGIWRRAGARVIAHQPGPDVGSPEEAHAWLQCTAEDLELRPVAGGAPGDDAIFALLYACVEPPPVHAAGLDEIGAQLLDGRSLGLAFVACAKRSAPIQAVERRRDSVLIALSCAFLAATMGMLIASWLVPSCEARPPDAHGPPPGEPQQPAPREEVE